MLPTKRPHEDYRTFSSEIRIYDERHSHSTNTLEDELKPDVKPDLKPDIKPDVDELEERRAKKRREFERDSAPAPRSPTPVPLPAPKPEDDDEGMPEHRLARAQGREPETMDPPNEEDVKVEVDEVEADGEVSFEALRELRASGGVTQAEEADQDRMDVEGERQVGGNIARQRGGEEEEEDDSEFGGSLFEGEDEEEDVAEQDAMEVGGDDSSPQEEGEEEDDDESEFSGSLFNGDDEEEEEDHTTHIDQPAQERTRKNASFITSYSRPPRKSKKTKEPINLEDFSRLAELPSPTSSTTAGRFFPPNSTRAKLAGQSAQVARSLNLPFAPRMAAMIPAPPVPVARPRPPSPSSPSPPPPPAQDSEEPQLDSLDSLPDFEEEDPPTPPFLQSFDSLVGPQPGIDNPTQDGAMGQWFGFINTISGPAQPLESTELDFPYSISILKTYEDRIRSLLPSLPPSSLPCPLPPFRLSAPFHQFQRRSLRDLSFNPLTLKPGGTPDKIQIIWSDLWESKPKQRPRWWPDAEVRGTWEDVDERLEEHKLKKFDLERVLRAVFGFAEYGGTREMEDVLRRIWDVNHVWWDHLVVLARIRQASRDLASNQWTLHDLREYHGQELRRIDEDARKLELVEKLGRNRFTVNPRVVKPEYQLGMEKIELKNLIEMMNIFRDHLQAEEA